MQYTQEGMEGAGFRLSHTARALSATTSKFPLFIVTMVSQHIPQHSFCGVYNPSIFPAVFSPFLDVQL